MDSPLPILALSAAAIAGAAAVFPKLHARLALSRAKHRSLTGHSKMSKMVARLLPFYEFDRRILPFRRRAARRRQAASGRLFPARPPLSGALRQGPADDAGGVERISDLQFTETYRVPFQYSRLVREHLSTSAFVQSSAGVTVTDIDGNVAYDLTGSYGVNIFGNDFYKECIAEAEKRAHALGPVLGPYHPVITDNVRRLCEISGLDEVSFHMSGTEAVMQAVRLARYHTRRSASGSLCRRLSRLVGRRAARRRQPGFAARDLYAGRHVGADAARAENAARHRLRAGQPAAGAASQRQRARRFRAGRQFAKGPFRSRRLRRVAEGAARGLHRARHRADLRRGVRRLPPRRRRRPGIFFGVAPTW